MFGCLVALLEEAMVSEAILILSNIEASVKDSPDLARINDQLIASIGLLKLLGMANFYQPLGRLLKSLGLLVV